MENDNNKNGIDTTALHNLMFFIIIVLLCIILFVTVKIYGVVYNPSNQGSLNHYDSMYSKRGEHISTDQAGNITGYNAPDGTHYTFDAPIPADIFYYTVN